MTDIATIGPGYVRTMAAYNAEMNRRVIAAADRLDPLVREQDGGAFWHSILGTMNHILFVDMLWLARLAGAPRPAASVTLATSDRMTSDWAGLREARPRCDSLITAWAAALGPGSLAGDLTFHSASVDREITISRARAVIQLFNHQTHHRGQVHALLTRAGEDTGATDLPFILPPDPL